MIGFESKFICTRAILRDQAYIIVDIAYKKQKTTACVFDYKGDVYAYINLCMHMQRPLDCQENSIFDETGSLLRCSMHGFVFDPKTGVCLSPVCAGEKLQSLKITEQENSLYFTDKHVQVAPVTTF